MTIRYMIIGDPMLDGNSHGNRDMWHYGFGPSFTQVGNYLHDVSRCIEFSSTSGVVEIPIKTWWRCVDLIRWWEIIQPWQRQAVMDNPTIISVALECYTDNLFNEIENFCDHINKSYSQVAVVTSNADPQLQEYTKLKVIQAADGWMQWFCHKWFTQSDGLYHSDINLPWKKYVCLNSRPRQHRLEQLACLASNGLIEHGHVSLGSGISQMVGQPLSGPITQANYNYFCERFGIEKSDSLEQILPIPAIDNTQTQINWSQFAGIDVVNEAMDDNQSSRNEAGIGASHFSLTEKTWRPIYYGMPFLLRCSDAGIDRLKALGYHAFDDLHDNTPQGLVQFLAEFVTWSRESIENFRPGYRKHNRDLYLHHVSNDTDNLERLIKEWIN
jgi:hypothetical protein